MTVLEYVPPLAVIISAYSSFVLESLPVKAIVFPERGPSAGVSVGCGGAIVDGVNIAKKHNKPTQDNPGGIQEKPMPIHISNLMLVDPKTGDATRIGRKEVDGKLVRYSKKSGEIIK